MQGVIVVTLGLVMSNQKKGTLQDLLKELIGPTLIKVEQQKLPFKSNILTLCLGLMYRGPLPLTKRESGEDWLRKFTSIWLLASAGNSITMTCFPWESRIIVQTRTFRPPFSQKRLPPTWTGSWKRPKELVPLFIVLRCSPFSWKTCCNGLKDGIFFWKDFRRERKEYPPCILLGCARYHFKWF